jgi:hypothetical protein
MGKDAPTRSACALYAGIGTGRDVCACTPGRGFPPYTQLRETVKFAADNSLPAIYPYREAVEAMPYGL